MKKINWKWALSVAAVIIVGLAMYNNLRSAVRIKTSKAVLGDIKPTVSVSGEIKGTDAKLSPKIPGVIAWIGAKEGELVNISKILIKFDTYENAKSDFERINRLYKQGFASAQQFETSKLQYDNSYLASPIEGVITSVTGKVGETASPGLPIVSIISPKSAYAELQVDESDIGLINNGDEVLIENDAYSDEKFNGKLINIGQQAELKKVGGMIKSDEEDRIIRAKAAFKDNLYKLKLGMTISADIIVEKKRNVLSVPRDAIFAKDSENFVFVIKGRDGFWGRQYVKEVKVIIGLKDSYNVEIKKGLVVGDEVAVTNLDRLKDRSKIIIEK